MTYGRSLRPMTLDPWILLVDLLACYRLTRLITKDSLLQEVRWWILQRWPSELTTYPAEIVDQIDTAAGVTTGQVAATGRLVYLSNEVDDDGENVWKPVKVYKWTELVECPYCASVWLAFGVLALRVWWDWWQYPAIALALAGGVALIFSRLDTE
jgi:hypothetical protein